MKIDRHGQAKILTQAEIQLLFSQGLHSSRDRALFGICLFTACRIREACTLRTGDAYDTQGRVLPVLIIRKGNTKGKLATRTIPIIDDLRRLLINYHPGWKEVYLFPGRFGSHLDPDSADKILRKATRRVGLIGVSSHSFRRTALTMMSDNGTPLRVIQEVSGHRNLEQLQAYIEVRDEQVLGAVTGLSMLSPVSESGKYEKTRLLGMRFIDAHLLIQRDSIGKKSRLALFELVSLPGIVHQSLALFIAVVLMSESVAAAPRRMGVSIAQQPAATSQDTTRAAADQAFEEGQQLRKQGTAESLRQAIAKYEQALPLYRAVGDRQSEAITLNNIGYIYDALGEKPKALEYYNQALPIFRAAGDRAGEAMTLNNMGVVYDALGEKPKALEYLNQSLPLRRATGDKAGEADTLNNIAGVYLDLGEKPKALEYYNQSLPLVRAMGDKAKEAVILNNIATVYLDLGEKQKALEFYNQSLPLSRATGDKAQEAVTLYNFASVTRSQGNLKSALTQIEAAIKIIEDLRSKIGSQKLRASYFATVQNYYQFYIDLLMQLHKTNPNKGYNALALNASERSRARSLIELLTQAQANIRSGADPKLLELERTLQQQLDALEKRRLELVSGKFTDAQLQTLEQERKTLQQKYQQLQDQIRQTSPRYASLKYPSPLTLSEIQQQVLDDDTLLLEYSLGKKRSYLWAVSKTSFTSYELPKQEDIETLAQSFYQNTGQQKAPEQRGLGAIPREDSQEITTKLSQILLSPVAGQLAGKRLLIVSDGALQYLPFAALPEPDSLGKSQDNSANLSPNPKRSPPAPLKKGGARGESDSPLPLQGRGARGVRFSSKDKTPVPLIVNHEIVNSPSASTIAILRQDTKGRNLAPKKLAVIADPVFSKDDERLKTSVGTSTRGLPLQRGNPNDLDSLALTRSAREADVTFQRLPFTRKESDRILSLIPNSQSQSAFDFAANRTTATSPQLSQYQIVHFATHGILNSQNPELSGVVLSLVDEKGTPQNGFLRLNDIFNLNLPAELIVLSACETGLGKEIKGEGLVGLTRGFMYAGSPRVLVSLWSVADEGTSELMSRFYKKMMQENLEPTAALRAAQLEMLQSPQWKSPYYWAAFTLQGEWKSGTSNTPPRRGL